MTAYDSFKTKNDPSWLDVVSRSEAGNESLPGDRLDRAVKYVSQFSTTDLPNLSSGKFIEAFSSGNRGFLDLVKKEAIHYSRAFGASSASEPDPYSVELLKQVGAAFGDSATKSIESGILSPEVAGNLMVAATVSAIRDIALVRHLHEAGKLSDQDQKNALDNISERMDKIGLNGINRLFESRPELETYLSKDTHVIEVGHLPQHLPNDKMTRAAYYTGKKEGMDPAAFDLVKTFVRENAIGKDFASLEAEKDLYIKAQINPPITTSPEIIESFAKLNLGMGNFDFGNLDVLRPLAKASDTRAAGEYAQFVINEGLAINHPTKEKFLGDLKLDLHGIATDESAGIRLKTVRTATPLLGDDSLADTKKADSTREFPKQSNTEDAKFRDTEVRPHIGSSIKNKNAAKIATIGGVTAVGLLMASGKDKRSQDDDKPDTKKHSGNVTKFVALASAAAISVGGVIAWSEKPQFLYKPAKALLNSLAGGQQK